MKIFINNPLKLIPDDKTKILPVHGELDVEGEDAVDDVDDDRSRDDGVNEDTWLPES